MQVNTDPGSFQQRMPRASMLSLNQKQVITGPRNGGLQAGKVDRTARYRILYVRRRQQAAVLDPSSGHAEFLRGLGRELGTEYEFIATNAQKQWRPGARFVPRPHRDRNQRTCRGARGAADRVGRAVGPACRDRMHAWGQTG